VTASESASASASASESASASASESASVAGIGLHASVRLRLSAHDAHYGGGLVDGAKNLALYGDVATELLIRLDGDEGLFRAYESVEFLAPLHAGDFVEAEGEILAVGKTSRKMKFVTRKYISPRTDLSDSAADVLSEPIVVCRAVGTCVVPAGKQRGQRGAAAADGPVKAEAEDTAKGAPR
jgi:3-aminobutyryl-CoA ammonia-lyase